MWPAEHGPPAPSVRMPAARPPRRTPPRTWPTLRLTCTIGCASSCSACPPASTYLGKFRTEANASILGFYVSKCGKLSFRNDAGAVTRYSRQSVTAGQWHEVQVHLTLDAANPTAGQVEVWYDGVRLADPSTAQNLSTNLVGRLQLSENDPTKSFDVVFDDVVADSSFHESQLSLNTTTWGRCVSRWLRKATKAPLETLRAGCRTRMTEASPAVLDEKRHTEDRSGALGSHTITTTN
jgi:hypothetical protein